MKVKIPKKIVGEKGIRVDKLEGKDLVTDIFEINREWELTKETKKYYIYHKRERK